MYCYFVSVKLWIENKKDQSSRQRRGKKSFNGKKGNAKESFTENKEPPSKLKMYTQETQTSPTLSQEVKVQSTNILDSACMSANFNSVISSKDEKSSNAAIDLSTDSSLSKSRSSRSSIYDFTETSESEYFPSEMELEETIEESVEESIVNSNKEKTATSNKSSGSENAITQESDGKIAVLPTMNDGKNRKWDKKYYCPFCEKPFSKLPRHMESAHPTEPEIAALIALEKDEKSKKMREQILCKLRNIGNHRYNCEVQKKGEGGLLVVHRPSEDCADPNNYVPCPTCFGYFAQRELWKHKCLLKGESSSNRVLSVARSLIPVPYYIENNVKDILSTMRQDEITNIVRSDKTICEIMRRMFHAKGGVEHHKKKRNKGKCTCNRKISPTNKKR